MVKVLIGVVLLTLLLPTVVLAAGFGISPGKVYINDLSPGESGSALISVCNEEDEGTTFTVSIRQPDYTAEGYEALWNSEYLTSDEEVYVPANSSRQVELTISAPAGEATELKKYETWIDVREKSPEGMIATACAVRVLITTTSPMIGFEVVEQIQPGEPVDIQLVWIGILGGLCLLLAVGWAASNMRRRHARQKS